MYEIEAQIFQLLLHLFSTFEFYTPAIPADTFNGGEMVDVILTFGKIYETEDGGTLLCRRQCRRFRREQRVCRDPIYTWELINEGKTTVTRNPHGKKHTNNNQTMRSVH